MGKSKQSKLTRAHLDKKLAPVKNLKLTRPRSGWLRAIRLALGMPQNVLADRLKIKSQSLVDIEKSEQSGKISMATLERVASELDCEVFYTLVPRTSLENTVEQQAEKTATKIIEHADLHMNLESQGTSKKFKANRIREVKDELLRANSSKKLWEPR